MQGHLWPKIFYCLAKNMNTGIARLKNKGGGGGLLCEALSYIKRMLKRELTALSTQLIQAAHNRVEEKKIASPQVCMAFIDAEA